MLVGELTAGDSRDAWPLAAPSLPAAEFELSIAQGAVDLYLYDCVQAQIVAHTEQQSQAGSLRWNSCDAQRGLHLIVTRREHQSVTQSEAYRLEIVSRAPQRAPIRLWVGGFADTRVRRPFAP